MQDNIVLYRKYRPQNFEEIIGQTHIVQTLTNSIKSGSLSHAYLFCGPRGSGKTTIARIFAKAVNCSFATANRQLPTTNNKLKTMLEVGSKKLDVALAKPCNKCDSCLEITASKSMDLVEIDAASHTGVDEVRELISGIKFSPVKSKYKIFIIDECQQLSKSAANALLKTLEEPPAHAIFMLATTEAHKMIPTIVSRCQRFDFKRLHTFEITKKLEFILKKEGIKFETAVLPLIALNARGSFRDAESLLDKCINFTGQDKLITAKEVKDLLGIVEIGQISKFVDFLILQQAKEGIEYINAMADEGVDLQEFAKTLVFYLRQCLLFKINPAFVTSENSGFSTEEISKMQSQTEKLTEKEIQNILELFIDAENKMKYASILQLPLELAVIDITHKIE